MLPTAAADRHHVDLPPAERGRPRGLLAPDARPVDPGALELRVDLGMLCKQAFRMLCKQANGRPARLV